MTTYYHANRVSGNEKTGPIPVTTTSADTCPDSCALKASGCYAKYGPGLGRHWRKVTAGLAINKNGRAGDLNTPDLDGLVSFIRALPRGQLWRMNQAGDLPGVNTEIDRDALSAIVQASKGRKGFTYTHKPVADHPANAAAVQAANNAGFAINLSADNPAMADRLADLGIAPVVTLLPDTATDKAYRTPAGRDIVTCPATIRDNVTCATCALCAKIDRAFIIGFPAHGSGNKTATRIAMTEDATA